MGRMNARTMEGLGTTKPPAQPGGLVLHPRADQCRLLDADHAGDHAAAAPHLSRVEHHADALFARAYGAGPGGRARAAFGSAKLTWFAGLIWFMIWGLYVLDLPTGPAACNHCNATSKLWLTFFSLHQDSGLLDGQGRFFATWPAVSMVGYSLGARIGLAGAEVPLDPD